MKKSLFMLLMLALSLSSFAQKGDPAKKAQRMLNNLEQVTGELTSEQKDALLDLYKKPKEERGKVSEQLKQILTPEQYEAYKKANDEKKARKAVENSNGNNETVAQDEPVKEKKGNGKGNGKGKGNGRKSK